MYVVGVGLVKRGILSVHILMSMSEFLSVTFYTLIKLCYIKTLE